MLAINMYNGFFENCIPFFTAKHNDEINLCEELNDCDSIKDIFDLVKDCVKATLKESRAGLDIGLVEIGNKPDGLLSAFYPVESNIIVVNSTPLRRITETNPELFKPYLFSILLHEYIHSLGYLDEAAVRKLSYLICRKFFGEEHPATKISFDMSEFFPYLLYPKGQEPKNVMKVIEVDDIDYIG
ncbi:MAG: hypothetical protein V1900_00605 [Candidatus Aenigmatarchaeota archaeon]